MNGIRIARILRGLLIILAILAGSEFLAYHYLAAQPSRDDYLYTRQAAYKDSEYWSTNFVRITNHDHLELDDELAILRPKNEQSPWLNVDDHIRRTTNQPQSPIHTIYLFGNSLVYGAEVPDWYTIASYLQRQLPSYQVVNMGVPGLTAKMERIRLESIALKRGDKVVFLDGYNDATDDYEANADKLEQQTVCYKLLQIAGRLSAMRLLCNWIGSAEEPFDITSALPIITSVYQDNLQKAERYARQNGAAFYHFLQPHIWSKSLSSYEQTLLSYSFIVRKGTDRALLTMYEAFRTVPGTIDLTHCLDDLRTAGVEIYLDTDHITEKGNAVIAGVIYNLILSTGHFVIRAS